MGVAVVLVVNVGVIMQERLVPMSMLMTLSEYERHADDHCSGCDELTQSEALREHERRDRSARERCDREDRRLPCCAQRP